VILDLLALLRTLCDTRVDFIIVGGVAANLHGASRTTLDLDVVAGENRLVHEILGDHRLAELVRRDDDHVLALCEKVHQHNQLLTDN
jgi:hypothetical protein